MSNLLTSAPPTQPNDTLEGFTGDVFIIDHVMDCEQSPYHEDETDLSEGRAETLQEGGFTFFKRRLKREIFEIEVKSSVKVLSRTRFVRDADGYAGSGIYNLTEESDGKDGGVFNPAKRKHSPNGKRKLCHPEGAAAPKVCINFSERGFTVEIEGEDFNRYEITVRRKEL